MICVQALKEGSNSPLKALLDRMKDLHTTACTQGEVGGPRVATPTQCRGAVTYWRLTRELRATGNVPDRAFRDRSAVLSS